MGSISGKNGIIRFKELPIEKDDIELVSYVMKSKSLGMGHTVATLEEEFADFVGVKYAVALNSCTNSIFLALYYCRHYSNKKSLVKIPSMMVPLVANEIIHTEYTPYFTGDTEWVGHAYYLGGVEIIDSAHEVKKRDPSDFDRHTVCYSFYPTKPICSADGGIICTNNKDEAEWYKKARYFGRDNGDSITKNSWEYGIEFPGWKMHMSDIQAAIALNQLRKFPYTDAKMTKIREMYNSQFYLENTSNYLYRISVESRDEFIRWMYQMGIECGVHFYPLHMMEIFSKYGHDDMTEVETAYKSTVSLPFHIYLTDDNIEYIVEKVSEWEHIGVYV